MGPGYGINIFHRILPTMSLCHIFTIFCVQVGHLVQGPQDDQNKMGSLFFFHSQLWKQLFMHGYWWWCKRKTRGGFKYWLHPLRSMTLHSTFHLFSVCGDLIYKLNPDFYIHNCYCDDIFADQRHYSQWRNLHDVTSESFQLLLNVQSGYVFCRHINNIL